MNRKSRSPAHPSTQAALLRVLGEEQRYVSRGGLKLEAALTRWQIDLQGRQCVDIGASTGGFTDCMLQHGAASVIAVDTGYGQIAEALRRDPRVSLRERTNARYLKPGDLGPGISFVSMDVSFISATLVLPAVLARCESECRGACSEAVILVKPQFEAGREHVGKGGIVHDPPRTSLRSIAFAPRSRIWALLDSDIADSPILRRRRGSEGNREFLLYGRF